MFQYFFNQAFFSFFLIDLHNSLNVSRDILVYRNIIHLQEIFISPGGSSRLLISNQILKTFEEIFCKRKFLENLSFRITEVTHHPKAIKISSNWQKFEVFYSQTSNIWVRKGPKKFKNESQIFIKVIIEFLQNFFGKRLKYGRFDCKFYRLNYILRVVCLPVIVKNLIITTKQPNFIRVGK